MNLTGETTLSEAKAQLQAGIHKGINCPVCDRYTKVYKRKFTSSMAIVLLAIRRIYAERNLTPDKDYIHLENELRSIPGLSASIRGDGPKIRFWGFIEPREKKKGENYSGFYKLTHWGVGAAEDALKFQDTLLIYQDKNIGTPNDVGSITITDALGNKFNYEELIKK